VVEEFHHKAEDRVKKAPKCCGRKMKIQISLAKPMVWKSITLEHINVEGETPLTFHTKKSLQDYCKKHKLSSGALL